MEQKESTFEIEDTIKRISDNKQVGIMILTADKKIIRSTYPEDQKEEAAKIAKQIPQLAEKAKSTVRELDCTNDLLFLRIKTKKYEIMVAPDRDFYLIVHNVFEGKKENEEKE